jgi:hypothetical protein
LWQKDKTMAERRRSPRHMITGQVLLLSDHQQLSGQLINASEAGIGLYAGMAASPGSSWTVKVALSNRAGKAAGQLELPAILVRQIHTGEGLYWGLALSGLSWEQRQRWTRLLSVSEVQR